MKNYFIFFIFCFCLCGLINDFLQGKREEVPRADSVRGGPHLEVTANDRIIAQPVSSRNPLVFEPFNRFDNELFGSLVLTWANAKVETSDGAQVAPRHTEAHHLGNAGCLIGAVVYGLKKGDTCQVEVRSSRFIRSSVSVVNVDRDDAVMTVGPTTSFNYEQLASLNQTVPFDVTIIVKRNDEQPVEKIEHWQAHQVNDCPTVFSMNYVRPDGSKFSRSVSAAYTVAGYVNENHPWIDSILKEAIRTKHCDSFVGYAGGEGKELWAQVTAIWQAIQNRGISYSSVASSTSSRRHYFQHIRFLDQSLSSAQANCIDGSVMFASILRKIGLNVGVVLVPGHAFVVVYSRDNDRRLFAIETTMVKSSSLLEAVRSATDGAENSLAKVYKSLDEKVEGYYEVNLTKCRDSGVLPIPFLANNSHLPALSVRKAERATLGGVGEQQVVAEASVPRTQSADPRALSRKAAVVEEIPVGMLQEQYFNSRGMMTSTQMVTRAREIADYFSAANMVSRDRRKLSTTFSQQADKLADVLKTDPNLFSNYSEWRDIVREIDRHRRAFNQRSSLPRLVIPSDLNLSQAQLREVEQAYGWSVSILRDVDPWEGLEATTSLNVSQLSAIVNRTRVICDALKLASSLPLEY